VSTTFMWLRIRNSGGILRTRQHIIVLHKIRESADQLSDYKVLKKGPSD